jgi:hypothetical protein
VRVRQSKHVAERRIGIGVGGSALNVEAQTIAIERNGFVEVTDDRAEEIARTDDEAGWRWTGGRRWRTSGRRTGAWCLRVNGNVEAASCETLSAESRSAVVKSN